VLPYLVFAIPAGWLADRFSKRHVIVCCKIAEIVIMSLAIGALLLQSFYLLLIVVFFMGAQSALFAPSKIGKIPELLDESQISNGNGLFNLATLSAVVIGMAVGNWLADATGYRGQEQIGLTTAVLVGIAILGTVLSFLIRPLAAANPQLRFPVNIVGATVKDLVSLYRTGALFRVALGVSFFWAFAALAQINIDAFSDESGAAWEQEKIPLLVSVVLGIGAGSVLAGLASRGKIELGLVPWAALGMITFAMALFFAPSYFLVSAQAAWAPLAFTCVVFALLGISAGFFDVPLSSYLQDRSPRESRGSILAATNFMLFGVVMLASLLYSEVLRRPVAYGSLDRLPGSYRGSSLPPDEAQFLDKLQLRYSELLEANEPERLPERIEFVRDLSGPQRTAAEARLLFVYAQYRYRQEEEAGPHAQPKIDLAQELESEYAEPDQRRMLKVVTRAAAKQPLLSSRAVFMVMGLLTIPVLLFAVWRLSRDMVRIAVYWMFRLVYRLKIQGLDKLPETGGALLVVNHASWMDGAVMLLMGRRHVRAIAWAGNFTNRALQWFADFAGIILISGGPKSIARGLLEARRTLEQGELVCIFAEGGISRTGQIQGLRPGALKIVEKTDVPVIPVYIDELWGSIFSYSGGRSVTKLPKTLRRPITVTIGDPLPPTTNLFELRQRLMELGAEAVNDRQSAFTAPAQLFIRQCKKRRFRQKISDSTKQNATGGSLLMRAMILRRLLRRHVLAPDEINVGVLIPPSTGGVTVNMALAIDRRVAVNLNYSVSNEIMNHCLREAGIRHVLTTRKVLEKFDFQFEAEVVFLDDLRPKVTLGDKLTSALAAYLVPSRWLERALDLHRLSPDDMLTVIFTSGSTGLPKGVMLTQRNIASNVAAIDQVICLKPEDVIIGVLPIFHSFGYTVAMWGVMGLNIRGAYHFSPLDAKQIGKLVQEYRGTVFLATPTFLRNYAKRCTPEEFKSLNVVVVGAEKMPIELADEFEQKFGVRPIEGYGTTELSPLVSVNIPPTRQIKNFQVDCKEGTVGRPIPNVAAKITDLDTGVELGQNQPGMLWIKGPNVMAGYLNHPEKTAEAIVD
ncbi:MAG TPA: MFS transporter, partial [Pirellulaceae bacterium]|nr:MFS transporter [Pirellulaceae bacterium]